jgi:hypothetical protein
MSAAAAYQVTPEEAERHARLYRLLDAVGAALKRHGVEYWAVSGTLLGAVRHGGIIPWDDDVDISVWARDLARARRAVKAELAGQAVWVRRPRACTVRAAGRPDVELDIFPAAESRRGGERVVRFAEALARLTWPREYLTRAELGTPRPVAFGPTAVPAPERPCAYLDRAYPGWASAGRVARHQPRPAGALRAGARVPFDEAESRRRCRFAPPTDWLSEACAEWD